MSSSSTITRYLKVNHYILKQLLAVYFQALGDKVSEDDVALMVSEADADGDGLINFKGEHLLLL